MVGGSAQDRVEGVSRSSNQPIELDLNQDSEALSSSCPFRMELAKGSAASAESSTRNSGVSTGFNIDHLEPEGV